MNKAVFFGIFFFLCYFFSIFFFCFCFFLFFFIFFFFFFFSSRRRHTRSLCDWSQTCALPILKLIFVRVVHFDVSQNRQIISRHDPVQVCSEIANQGPVPLSHPPGQCCGVRLVRKQLDAVVFQQRRFRRECPSLLILRGQLACGDFAGFNIRLIERIAAHDRSCHGCRDLPTE